MERTTRFLLAIGAGLLWLPASLLSEGASSDSESWPQFRGPDGLSVARDQEIPMNFGPNENVLWSTPIPKGNSSPIIWRDHLFLSAYRDDRRIMLAIDRHDGSLIWERSVTAHSPEEFTHRLSGPAESTPCTDGKRVYFYFGNYGLIALNFDGSLAWEKQLSKPRTGMGTGTSPILIGNSLILIRDGTDDPCILSLNSSTGEEIWKHPRLGYTTSHSSPFVWKNKLQTELVIAGTSSLVSLNPATGKLLWKTENTNGFPCTTPTGNADRLFFASWSANSSGGRDTLEAHFDDDIKFSEAELADPDLFFRRFDQNRDGVIEQYELPPSRARDVFKWLDRNDNQLWETDEFDILLRPPGKGRNIMVAVRPGGAGVLNGTEYIAWEWQKHLPYTASPLLSGNRVYLVKSLGIITCLNTETGEPHFEGMRTGVKGEYFASPIKVGSHILITSSLGTLTLIRDSNTFEIAAQNDIGEEIVATPAVVDNTLYLRSLERLWAFKRE
jgi:outer membrane protein assembly factor BamB